MVLGCLHDAPQWDHSRYLGQLCLFPMHPPWIKNREDQFFMALSQDIPKTPHREHQKDEWISEEMWHLADTRVAVRREPQQDQRLIR